MSCPQKRPRINTKSNRPSKKRKTCELEYVPFPEDDWEEYEDVEWISSHLIPSKILWSSDPAKIKPNIDISRFQHEGENKVVNTWFVHDPQLSSSSASHWQSELKLACELIEKSSAVLIVAGAGMGVDSGLPDYRGPSGFWKAYPLLKEKGLSLEDMSHPDWFKTDPTSAWGFYAHRSHLYHSASPHKGFHILRKIVEEKKKGNYFVFTSNIDSQFQAAGFDDNKIFEAHGNLSYLQCTNEDCDQVWKAGKTEIPEVDDSLRPTAKLPMCSKCGSLARPNVSMFGDTNLTWKDSRVHRQKELFLHWLRKCCPNLVQKTGRGRPRTKFSDLVVLEIGCGISLHSLRMEVELLIMLNSEEKSGKNKDGVIHHKLQQEAEPIKKITEDHCNAECDTSINSTTMSTSTSTSTSKENQLANDLEEHVDEITNVGSNSNRGKQKQSKTANLGVIRINPTSHTFNIPTSSVHQSPTSTSDSERGTILKLENDTVCVGLGLGSKESMEEIGRILLID